MFQRIFRAQEVHVAATPPARFLRCVALASAVFLSNTVFAAVPAGSVVINEFMASNNSTVSDEAGDFDDWLELYNTTAASVDVGGMYITDDLADPTQWQIPANIPADTTIPAGGYLIIWMDDDTDGPLHSTSKLGASGEDIGLFDTDGATAVDTYTFGQQTTDVSEGRTSDGDSTFVFFSNPSPGSANVFTGSAAVDDPVFDVSPGVVSGPLNLNLSVSTAGADIHYTLDGSDPDQSDPIATGPITLSDPVVVRARAWRPGFVPSAIVSNSYLVNVSHTFPVLSISADPELFYDPATGIFPNFLDDIEIVANIEFYETDNTQGINQLAEIEVAGRSSAAKPQKSLAIKAKSGLGSEYFNYPLFPNQSLTQYRAFVARNSGQDNGKTMFKDAYLQSLVYNTADAPTIIAPDLDAQDYRPAVAYINGEYYGILNLRERIDWRYIDVHYGVDRDDVDLIERRWTAKEGSLDALNDLYDFMRDNDLSIESNFDVVRDNVDIENFIDYFATEIYIDNSDWPSNNLRQWRERKDGEKWRWMMYDVDVSAYADNTDDSLARLLDPALADTDNNPAYATEFFRLLMTNAGFRAQFANRMADKVNVLFDPTRTEARLQDFLAAYTPERQQHADRWDSGQNDMFFFAGDLSAFFSARPPFILSFFENGIPEITGTTSVTVDASPASDGHVQFNTLIPQAADLPMTGTFFTGIEIPMLAVPEAGKVFTGWSVSSVAQTAASSIVLTGPTNLTASFGPGSTATAPMVISEINYNSADCPDPGDWVEIHNPGTGGVDVSGWMLQDEGGGFYSLPANTVLAGGAYLVIAEDLNEFQSVYPTVSNVVGSFGFGPNGFGLKGSGEEIQLLNAAGTMIDIVDYDDASPWPTSPDGDGDSAQLVTTGANNNDGANWTGTSPTPGGAFGTTSPAPASSCGSTGGSSGGSSSSSSSGSGSSSGGSSGSGSSSSSSSSSGSSGSGSSGGSGNTQPSLIYPGTISTQCNTPISLQLTATDADGDTLIWSAQNLPAGLSIDQTGLISGTIPAPTGANVTVEVSDGLLSSGEARFYWGAFTCATSGGGSSSSSGSTSSSGSGSSSSSTSGSSGSGSSGGSGTNTKPTLNNPGTITTQCNVPVTLQLVANDADGDALTWSVQNLLPGLSVDQNGLISGVIAQPGGANIIAEVSDGNASSGDRRFFWGAYSCATSSSSSGSSTSSGSGSSSGSSSSSSGTGSTSSGGSTGGGSGSNARPTLNYPGTVTTQCNTPISLQLVASDPDGDALVWTAQGLPSGLSIDQTGLISGAIPVPTGSNVSVSVSDGTLDSREVRFYWGAFSCAI